jgi:hypothetical protein
MDPNGFTITTNTTEEVTLTTTTDDITALREQIAALTNIVSNLAAASPAKQDDDTAPEAEVTLTSGEVVEVVLTSSQGDADDHGFVPSTVDVMRPDAPPEPEPEPEPEPAVATGDADPDSYPTIVNGVRPSEDVNIWGPSRISASRGNHAVARGIGAYTQWQISRGFMATGITITDRLPANSLLDWIAFSSNIRMSKAQARTALLRMEEEGHVKRNGKSGKQDLWMIDPNGGFTRYLS